MEHKLLEIANARSLNPNSIKLYMNKIDSIHQSIFKTKASSVTFLKDVDTVMAKVNAMNLSSRKLALSAILVFISPIRKTPAPEWKEIYFTYNDHLNLAINEYKKYLKTQKMSLQQMKNWTSMKELHSVRESFRYYIKKLGYLSSKKTKDDLVKPEKHFDLIQKWVVASLYTLMPPRRSKDYRTMKIIHIKKYNRLPDDVKQTSNFLIIYSRNRKLFHFADYKTRNSYGVQEFELSRELNSCINYWLRYNTTGYLLVRSNGSPFEGSMYNKYLHSVFEKTGKKVSSSLIRNIYLTELYDGETSYYSKEKIALQMAHSVEMQQKVYRKKTI